MAPIDAELFSLIRDDQRHPRHPRSVEEDLKLMTGLSTRQLASYERDGFLVIEDFAGREECERLRRRAEELVRGFDPQGVISIFSTREQARASDDYFLDSGDKVRFFFEEDAFAGGGLRYDKERSINKIGHALHDLDPVFDAFSRKP